MAKRIDFSRLPLWPQKLLARMFLLIAALMGVAVISWLAIFERIEMERRSRQIAQIAVSVSNLTRAALLAARPEHRRALLAELSDREGIRIYPANPDDEITSPPDHELFRRVAREIESRTGEKAVLALAVNGETGFFLRFRLLPEDEHHYWLGLPRPRFERALPLGWLAWGTLTVILALACAGWIVWRLNRPLGRLALAARKVGAGETVGELPEEGPSEIVTVIRAFNQMNVALARAAEERALLLAGISHDLRTPLARLRMDIEMQVEDPAVRAMMEADIEEMDRTIGQFLDFARPSAKDGGSEIDLSRLLTDLAHRHSDSLATEIAPGIASRGDEAAISRAIANLIDNAQRHGKEPIEVRLSEAEGWAIVEIADRGPGVPATDLARLKKPFERGEAARSNTRGAGLGLAIVDRIASKHGGRLEIANRPGGGFVARLYLPLLGKEKR